MPLLDLVPEPLVRSFILARRVRIGRLVNRRMRALLSDLAGATGEPLYLSPLSSPLALYRIFPHATFVVENAAQRDRFPPTAKVHIELSAKCIKGTPTLAKMLAIVAQILKSVRTPPALQLPPML